MLPTLADASPWVLAGLAVAALGLPLFLGMGIGLIPSLRLFFDGDRSRWRRFWMITVAALWIAALTVVAFMARAGVWAWMVGARRPSVLSLAISAAVIMALAVGAFLVGTRASGPGPTDHGAIFFPHTTRERLLMVLVIAPSAALCEELLYRGYLLAFLRGAIGLWPANAIQALLFGFHHGGIKQGPAALLSRAAIGFIFGVITARTGTLAPAVALHFLFDAVIALKPPAVRAEQPA